jgi:peptidoglycan/xylan/chitin deacetylase (PgdA/CDA1 family)
MPVQSFQTMMRRLAAEGFQGISIGAWMAGAVTEGDPVILTFDDGFESVHAEVLPELQRHGFTATVFPIVAGLGSLIDWRAGGRPLPCLKLLDASQLRELVASGWEVGAHTVHHEHLPSLDRGEVEAEVAGSRRMLEDLLGSPVTSFAYPFGAWTQEVAEVVAESGFTSSWTTRPGRVSDRRLLTMPRYMMPPRATFTSVRAALGGTLPALHWLVAGMERSLGRQAQNQVLDPGTECNRFVADRPPEAGQTRSRSGVG